MGTAPGPEAAEATVAAAADALPADKRSYRLGEARRRERQGERHRPRRGGPFREPQVLLQGWVKLETPFPQIR